MNSNGRALPRAAAGPLPTSGANRLPRALAGLLLACAAVLAAPPEARAGAFATTCVGGCHVGENPTPLPIRFNAANSSSVVWAASAANGMTFNSPADVSGPIGDLASLAPTPANTATVTYTSWNAATTSVAYGGTRAVAVPNISLSGILDSVYDSPDLAEATFSGTTMNFTHSGGAGGNCNPRTVNAYGTGPAQGGVTPVTAARVITVNVNDPSPPTTASVATTINYSTSNTLIDLGTLGGWNAAGTPPGSSTSVVLGALSLGVGSRSAAGPDSLNYAASSSVYAASQTLSFTITGPCGVAGTTRTLTINVNLPPAPAVIPKNSAGSPLVVPAGSATPIDLTDRISGVVASNPAATYALNAFNLTPAGAGSLSVTGNVVTFTPTAGFTGPATFSFTKAGPGGTSNTATAYLDVTAAPVVSPTSVTTAFNTAVAVNLAAFIGSTQPVTSVTPSSPVNGTASATGTTQITFTPTAGFYGTGSFNYVATNAVGTSATPATVTVTVNPPPPTVSATTLTAAYNTGSPPVATAIDLAPFITGPFTSVTPASPVNGTVSVAGSVVSFTPTAGYIGPASFTYTATNPGGTSAPATVSVTVAPPPPPVTANRRVRVSATAPTSFDLAPDITGLYTSVAVVQQPVPGSVALAGTMATYTPRSGFTGETTFTYSATGPGGASTPGTVTLVYTTSPVTSNRTLVVRYNTSGTIDLTSAFAGDVTTWSVTKQPQHGSVSTNGPYATYTPFQGYFGPDSFEFTAVGPGGTSAPGVVSVTVNPPSPVAAGLDVDVPFGTPVAIDLAPAAGGVASSFRITEPPQHGTVAIAGNIATYTPNAGFAGADGFAFVAVNATGTSPPARVNLTVGSQAPGAATASLTVPVNGSGTIDLAPYITGSLISGVSVAVLPTHGLADVNGTKVTYTPRTDYFGADTFTYVAYGNAGTTQPVVVLVTIEGRPDPSQDRTVVALLDAQAQAARRFSRAQIGNFQRRLESLHAGAPAGATAGEKPAAPPKAASAAPTPPPPANADPFAPVAPRGGFVPVSLTAAEPPRAAPTSPFASKLAGTLVGAATAKNVDLAALTGAAAPAASQGGTQVWMGGLAHFGKIGGGDEGADQRFSTDGLSLGADRRISDRLVLGLGLGYGRDRTDIGDDGSRSKASGMSFAGYGSYQPSRSTFVDAVLGFGRLDLDSERYVPSRDAYASAAREGTQFFGSVAAGYELRREGLLVSPYGRLDVTVDKLDQATETGAGPAALSFHEQTLRSTQAAAGIRVESRHETDFGWTVPRARLEYRHEFEGGRTANLSYADLLGGITYSVTPAGSSRNSLLFGLGADFLWRKGLRIGIDYQGERNSNPGTAQAIRFLVSQDLDGRVPAWPASWSWQPFVDPVSVEAGFAFDDNVSRGRLDAEKLTDQVYSFGLNTSRIFPINPNLRAQATALLSVDKFHEQTGLGRTSGGLQGELQYRASGDFDSVTYALFARGWIDAYESKLRSGSRLSAGANARRSLTDRIDAFGEVGVNWRRAESDVFAGREYAARFNFDYSLGSAGTAYLTGEYRRGDTFASGFASLWNLNLADVFVRDDALEGGEFFSYRFEATTLLGTLGYNRPLGPRDSIDFSYRRVRTTPLDKPPGSGPTSYDVNQYSILYLMRF